MTDHNILLFDAHAHFFTNDFAAYPVNLTGALEGEENLRKRIEDNPSTDAAILAHWDELGIAAGAAVQYNQVYKTDNSYTIAVADRHPGRITAVVLVAAADPATPGWLRETCAAHNVSAIRLFGLSEDGRYSWLDSDQALETWRAAADLGLAVDLMFVPGKAAPAALPRIARVAEQFPDTPIVLDHCAWPIECDDPAIAFSADHRALAARGNVHFKYTQVNPRQLVPKGMDMALFLREAVDIVGAERCMWGSDYGNTKATYAQMADGARAATAHLSPAERAAVLHDTGYRVFGKGPA